jgi:hypothetical protein
MPGYVEVTCVDHKMFKCWSTHDLHSASCTLIAAAERVEAGTMTQTAFADMEKMIGLNLNPHGILADNEMVFATKPLESMRYDWVHSMLQGGVFTIEVEAILDASPVTRAELQDFLAADGWEYPHRSRAASRQLHRVFAENRVPEDNPAAVKASCSELLGLFGILRFFFAVRLGERPELARELETFDAACVVMDLLLAAKTCTVGVGEASAALQQATRRHLQLHVLAYGDRYVKPKHHWMQDVAPQIAADNLVLDAFVIERVHLRIKAAAENVDNTSSFERSVLSSALTSHLQALKGWRPGGGLLGRTAVLDTLAGVMIADRMSIFGVSFSVDDVVLRGDTVGILVACLRQDGELYGLVREMRKEGDDITGHAASYVYRGGQTVWAANELQLALAWRHRSDESVLVIRR